MPFLFTPAANPLFIYENQYGSADKKPTRAGQTQPTVRFIYTAASLCIVAPSINRDRAIGIQIPLIDSNNNVFSVADVPTVTALLNGMSRECLILGPISLWQGNVPRVYAALEQALRYAETYDRDDGIYAAGFDLGDRLEPLHYHRYDET